MIRRPPRSTRVRSSAASDVYKRQTLKTRYQGPCTEVPSQGGLRSCNAVFYRVRRPFGALLQPFCWRWGLGSFSCSGTIQARGPYLLESLDLWVVSFIRRSRRVGCTEDGVSYGLHFVTDG